MLFRSAIFGIAAKVPVLTGGADRYLTGGHSGRTVDQDRSKVVLGRRMIEFNEIFSGPGVLPGKLGKSLEGKFTDIRGAADQAGRTGGELIAFRRSAGNCAGVIVGSICVNQLDGDRLREYILCGDGSSVIHSARERNFGKSEFFLLGR